MATNGIQGLFVHTRNWGATVAFWSRLGYEVEFETGRGSGRLVHPEGGPYLFVAEDPGRADESFEPVLEVHNRSDVSDPEAEFAATHWGTLMAQLRDPDGRLVAIEAPCATNEDYS